MSGGATGERPARSNAGTGRSPRFVDVSSIDIGAPPDVSKSVPPLAGLEGSVGGYFGDDGGSDPRQRNRCAWLCPASDAELVWPGVIFPGWLEDRSKVGRLLRGQRDRAPDLDELVAAVAAGDDDLGVVDGAEDAADDHLDSVAPLHPSSGLQDRRALSRLPACPACTRHPIGSRLGGLAWLVGRPWSDDTPPWRPRIRSPGSVRPPARLQLSNRWHHVGAMRSASGCPVSIIAGSQGMDRVLAAVTGARTAIAPAKAALNRTGTARPVRPTDRSPTRDSRAGTSEVG